MALDLLSANPHLARIRHPIAQRDQAPLW